ncbi:DUF6268 family outer membrane beta-barrel protein [Lentiprolixibacter aurantiacus]|uniref:DUF6268 family outer membrane beta-barrel protein n=1 Tax=Lentiprolixibacter aurantiacus TaxID=2993939 RepID=A0AAE3MNF4_9FLAO|nr:DUF6268 family outer membrane beta-barrel protein [Lentiprolixibacter aurantiacus]MCX2720516.1 DUF6268 family outer membrane beta-barrel protein [Lentiprolixibacter aurantiacus]
MAFSGLRGQSTDLLRLEYTNVPNGDSGVETSRYRFLLNIPFKLKGGQYLIVGSEYNYIDFDTTRDFPFDDSELEHLHVIDLNLGYIFKWNKDWRFVGILTPRLASNLVTDIVGRDFLLNLTATFWKEVSDTEKPFRLVLGLTYNSTTGLPFPMPLINYYRRFDPSWSFTLGIPRSDFRYHISEKNTLLMALFLDGYFVNAQNDIILPDNDLGSAISLSALVSALGYQFNISKMASFYGFAGYTLLQNGVLRDDKRNNVFNLNNDGSLYFKVGFKVSIF